jgi:hypothetical protein
MMDCPRPGDTFDGRTVIASGWNTDDSIGLMLLREEPPYFEVTEWSEAGCLWSTREPNIVPATALFDAQFGFWG